jgi:hypothetical protein
MSAKRMLIILGVLIALFFVVTGWGQLSDEQSAGGVAEAIVNMIRWLETKEPLSPNDLASANPSDCREQLRRKQFTLAEGQSCRLEVGDASDPVRTLTLRLQQGRRVHLQMIGGGENGVDQTETLPTDSEEDPARIELQFVREGGRLVIACTDATPPQNQCVLNVLSS